MDNGAVQVLQALIESRRKSVEAIDAALVSFEDLRKIAKGKALLGVEAQLKLKRQRRVVLLGELEAYRSELERLEALEQPQLPGVKPEDQVEASRRKR